jgi:hypothetical protein
VFEHHLNRQNISRPAPPVNLQQLEPAVSLDECVTTGGPFDAQGGRTYTEDSFEMCYGVMHIVGMSS